MFKSNSLCEQIARTCGWTQVNGQIYKLLEKKSADGDEPNALYANDWEEAYLLACGNSTAEDGSPTQREYSFDIKLLAAVRVKATSPDQARQLLHELFDSADCNGGAWPSGDPVLFEASLVEGQEPVLVTHDGHDAPVDPAATTSPQVLVVVAGGCAETYTSGEVDVTIYDKDMDDSGEEPSGVPLRFAHLAEPLDIPVEGEST